MIESLSDIEALAVRCNSEQSKIYIAEAISCYRSGAYRASIVSTWIAVVFDLIDKIRELALQGDGTAKTLEARHEGYIQKIEQGDPSGIRGALDFERELLAKCKDQLQFFDPQQYLDLDRLKDDRHRCAHPSFQRIGIPYYPSAEQARLHIRNAIVHVLAQPPVQGRAALAQLKAIVGSDYFPTDDAKAFAQLRTTALNKATDALVKGFIDELVFGFVTDGDPLCYKKQAIAAINATFELYPGISEERLRLQINKVIRDVSDQRFTGAAYIVAYVGVAWRLLEQVSIDKVASFIALGPASEVMAGFEVLSKIPTLREAIELRVNAMTFEELADAISTYELRSVAVSRALHFLSEVRSWDRANEVFTKAVLPLFSSLARADVERVLRMPTEHNADLPGAHGFKLFVDAIKQKNLIDEQALNSLLSANGAGYLVPQNTAA